MVTVAQYEMARDSLRNHTCVSVLRDGRCDKHPEQSVALHLELSPEDRGTAVTA